LINGNDSDPDDPKSFNIVNDLRDLSIGTSQPILPVSYFLIEKIK